jgi:hypothetical protein
MYNVPPHPSGIEYVDKRGKRPGNHKDGQLYPVYVYAAKARHDFVSAHSQQFLSKRRLVERNITFRRKNRRPYQQYGAPPISPMPNTKIKRRGI